MAKKQQKTTSIRLGLDKEDKRALWRTVLISSVLLGLVLTLAYMLLGKVFAANPKLLNALRTAISLLVFWVFVTSTIRAYDRVRPDLAFFWLILVGVVTAGLGILLFLFGLRIWNELGGYGATLPSYNIIGFYTAGGLVASLISLIHIRIENKKTGNLLELLVLILTVIAFFWVT